MDIIENLEKLTPQETTAGTVSSTWTTKTYIEKIEVFIRKHLTKDVVKYCDWTTIYDLENEKARILKKAEYYRDVMCKYNIIKSSICEYEKTKSIDNMSMLDIEEDDGLNLEFTSRIIRDLEWLRTRINSYNNKYWNTKYADEHDINHYENILERISTIINIYIKICDNTDTKISQLLLIPNHILDYFFYQDHIAYGFAKAKMQEHALDLLKKIEAITYIVINRTEEYEFDLRNYDHAFHRDIDITTELLDILIYRLHITL